MLIESQIITIFVVYILPNRNPFLFITNKLTRITKAIRT